MQSCLHEDCQHLNSNEARFCKTCGRPLATNHRNPFVTFCIGVVVVVMVITLVILLAMGAAMGV